MTSDQIARIRIVSQHIGAGKFKKAAEVVAHLGALQAQDFAMVRWAVGLRSASLTEQDVFDAYNKGEILRTHILRPTWHLVANDDVDWMLRLTAPRLLSAMQSFNKKLKLTEEIFSHSNRILEKTTAAGPVTRDAAIAALQSAKPGFPSASYTLLLFRAELERIIISGPLNDRDGTYAAYGQRVKKTKPVPHEEALARLALRYFMGHGPATLDDYIWWSGLKTGDARAGLESVRRKLAAETFGGSEYFFNPTIKPKRSGFCLLPAFDEFIIGYADRSAVLGKKHQAKVMTKNGLFRPTIVCNDTVQGIWKKEIQKGKPAFKAEYFTKPDAKLKSDFAEETRKLKLFLGVS